MARATVAVMTPPHAQRRHRSRPRGSVANLLRILVAVPLVAVVGFAGLAVLGRVRQVVDAGNAQKVAALAVEAGALAKALQAERAAAAVALTTTDTGAVERFDLEVAQTNSAIVAFEGHDPPTEAVEPTLRRVDTGLANLANVRGQVRYSPAATLSSISFRYRILIADLLALREAVAAGAPAKIVDDVRAAAALAQVGESIGQLQIVVLRSLAIGELTPDAQQGAASATARLTEASNAFLDLAQPAWAAQWEQVGANPQVITAQRLRDEVGRTGPGETLQVEANEWITTTNAWITELYRVQQTVDAAVVDEVAAIRGSELRLAAVQTTGVAVVIGVAAVLTSVVARRVTRRLRWLRDAASAAAYQRLPVVVRELNAAPMGTLRHDEVADRAAADLVVDREHDDEIAAVGAAVRALFREAVRTAGEQALMRRNVADMFVHLSHREQRLVDALLAQVDRVEYDETDPERLRQLYQLDNLATRMGRINQSLLVLGGAGTSRVRPDAVPMVMVVQAALSQIEQYPRVRIGHLDTRMHVAGEVVDEMAHMLAELLDNATTYSPPETEVWVTGQPLPDRLILQLVDQGIGLSQQRREQINELLATPVAVELTGVRAMGLMVVSRLASRHRVRVELRANPRGGTVAEVTIPWTLLSWRDPAATISTSATPVVAGRRDRRSMPSAVGWAPAPGGQTVNGWFRTQLDGADAAVVTWPTSDGERWAGVSGQASEVTAAFDGGLPRRVPQPHLVPAAPSSGGASAGSGRRLDPMIVAAAMSAYARAVRDAAQRPPAHTSRSLERPRD